MQTFFSDAMTKYDPLQMCDNSKKEKKKRKKTKQHWKTLAYFFQKTVKAK